MAMRIRDVMTPDPVVVGPDASVTTVRETMRQRRIHHLPMVDGGQFAGVVDATQAFGWVPREAVAADLVGRVAVEAHPDEALFEVLGRCAWSPRDVCVVTRPDSRAVVGIVTERDLVRLAARYVDPSRTIDQIASTTVVTTPITSTVGECLEQVRERMFRHLVVVDDGRLRGTLALRDLLLADARAAVTTLLPEEVRHATWAATIQDVATIMERHDLDAMPLVDDDQVPDGIVTVTDLLRALRSTPSLVT
ncbi:MAG: CBS domain-containing protein [Myxococcota bacterium]